MVTIALACAACHAEQDEPPLAEAPVAADRAELREQMLAQVRRIVEEGLQAPCALPSVERQPLHVVVSLYFEGTAMATGTSTQPEICAALTEATLKSINDAGLDPSLLDQVNFAVELPNHGYGFIEHEGRALEFVDGIVPVRSVDKAMVRARIDEGRDYLLRVMDPELGGVHKYYYASSDSFEDRLHAIYTASTIYTLLLLHEHDKDPALREPIDRAAEFLLSMQRIAPGQPGHGAFHYSLELGHRSREPRYVVGTTSKTIFSLIELHELTKDERYLAAAHLAAQWLMSMQREDGSVAPELHLDESGEWVTVERESMLYTGQVLSALSRLHQATGGATGETHYLDAATRIAAHLRAKVEREGCYLGDDYRSHNPISSSWVILSLFDYARASGDIDASRQAYTCADALLGRQIDSPGDIASHGRWSASLSSSGAGWMAEVLSTLYLDCPEDDPQGCSRYREAVVLLLRLLMQHTYGPENSFAAKNPAMARGGLFWNAQDRYVRTDAVCHAMNAYVLMLDELPEGVLLELPEPGLDSLIRPK